MEVCPNCKNEVAKKVLTCKFCDKFFCSMTCLIQHSSLHSKTNGANTLITSSLKKKQTKNQTEQYNFITQGVFTDNYQYDKFYDIENFSKIYDGFIPLELGVGSYGRVYLVTHNITQKKYALKVINKHKLMQTYGTCQLMLNEIDIHSKINHPNIIRLYNFKETDEEINILLEYAEGGNLFSLIQKENGFPEHIAYKYFIQMVNAVYFLHQNNIIHRDIKPENILIGENGVLKLCDFGWAKEITVNNRSTFCGTIEYMAPEIVGSEKYDFGVDVWSLGVLLYELLMGHSPFKSNKEKNVMIKIKQHDLVFDKNRNLSENCINLINGLLDSNPATRFKIKDIFEHPFILINSKLYMRSNKRKESLDDSSENILKYFNKKNVRFKEDFQILREKFGFDSKSKFKDKMSSKQLKMNSFKSDKNLIKIKRKQSSKIEIKETQRLEQLYDNMSNELEKGKKKVGDLNFKSSKQLSFEDFRDHSKWLDDDKKEDKKHSSRKKESKFKTKNDRKNFIKSDFKKDESYEDSIKFKDTLHSSNINSIFGNEDKEPYIENIPEENI